MIRSRVPVRAHAAPLVLATLAFALAGGAPAQAANFCAGLLRVVSALPQGFTGLSTEAMPGAEICGVTEFGLTNRPAFECKWQIDATARKSAETWFAQTVGRCVPGWRYQASTNAQGADATFQSAAAEIVVTEPARDEVSVMVAPPPH